MPPRTYEIHWTEPAAKVRDRLGDGRRAVFERGIALLAADPFHPKSRAAGPAGAERTVRLTADILVEYVVSRGRLLVFAVAAFAEGEVLVPDE
ncbi:hypothetical protein AB0I00_28885 [Streptomyces sp. NPDC050803]|uniref:hypothetical protein n=1 Tax=unclassified Streptomyces TaxID=2593676 RepID=UPI00343A8036